MLNNIIGHIGPSVAALPATGCSRVAAKHVLNHPEFCALEPRITHAYLFSMRRRRFIRQEKHMSLRQETSLCIPKGRGNHSDHRNGPIFFIENVSARTDPYDQFDLDLLGDVPADVMTRCEAKNIASKHTAVISACGEVG
jgi:hypothetical protein